METDAISFFLPCRFGPRVRGALGALCERLMHGTPSAIDGRRLQELRAELSLALYGMLAKDGVDSFASWDVLQELETLDDMARLAPMTGAMLARRSSLSALVPPCGSPSRDMLQFLESLGPNALTHRQARSIIGECASKLAEPLE